MGLRYLYEDGVIEDDTIKNLSKTYKFNRKHNLEKSKV